MRDFILSFFISFVFLSVINLYYQQYKMRKDICDLYERLLDIIKINNNMMDSVDKIINNDKDFIKGLSILNDELKTQRNNISMIITDLYEEIEEEEEEEVIN